VSNSDWPGPYWQQQQDDAGSGWRSGQDGPPQEHSPWDDNDGFWRDGPQPGPARGRPGSDRESGRPGRRPAPRGAGNGHGGTGAHGNGRDGRQGRFSQTADDLRGRLGMRGSAGSSNGSGGGPSEDEDFWYGADRGRASREPAVDPAGRTGYRGTRRASAPGTGPDDDGTGLAGRTALRDRTAVRDGTGVRGRTGLQDPAAGGRGGTGGRGSGPAGFDGPPPSRGERFKRWLLSGRWWRHWTWKKAVGVLAGGFAAVVLLGVATFFYMYEHTPIPTETDLTASWQSSTVYFANGKPLGTFTNNSGINRQLLAPDQIPKIMTDAMTAAEDRGFYTEGGISVTGLLRSAFDDVFGSGGLQGGSTITMQYAKNYYTGVDAGQQATTKIKEIFIAMKLAHKQSKQWIMTQYLNTVPFGGTNYGLGAASQAYFDIDLTKPGATLSPSQAAMLAAMPNEPGVFSPNPADKAGYAALQLRWRYVLTNMVRDGNITQQEANQAKFPAYTPPPNGNGESGYTGYLLQMVEQELEAPVADGGQGLTQQQVDTGGYHVTTTFSKAKVEALARSINQEKAAMRLDGAPFHDYDRIGAVLEDPKTGAITAVYGGPGYGSARCGSTDCDFNTAEAAEPVGSSFKPYVLSTAVHEDMNVFTSRLNGYSPIWIPENPENLQTETMLSSLSPPPGVSAQDTVGLAANGIYYFKFDEAGEDSNAPLPVNVAAAISSDPAFEDLAHRDGIDSVINMAKSFGVGQNAFVDPCQASESTSGSVPLTIRYCNDLTGPGYKVGKSWYAGHGLEDNFSTTTTDKGGLAAGTPGSPAIALGENPLTPVEQATTFATLADEGLYHTPHVILKLQQGTSNVPLNLTERQVLSPAAAADVDWALSFDNQLGSGTAYENVPFRRGGVIGKTGTLGQNTTSSQAWFIGATPDQEALSVALFTNDPGTQVLNNLPTVGGTPGSQGGGWPATIWNNFMMAEFANTPASPMFPTVNSSLFQKWIQVAAQPLPICKHGQTKHCKPGKNPFRNPNPNPTPSCGTFGAPPCGTGNPTPSPPVPPTPSPSPTCQQVFPGGPCVSSSPSPSPSTSDSPQPPGGTPAGTAKAGSAVLAGAAAVEDAVISPAEDSSVVLAAGPLRLVAGG
jgi:membrane peptidoglycan carboxypeptidase